MTETVRVRHSSGVEREATRDEWNHLLRYQGWSLLDAKPANEPESEEDED